MEKVYLLLRNNIESGPFTLNELLQQQLLPADMIWVEGRSTAWTYLSEMELNFHQEPEITKTGRSQNVKPVGDDIEQKAEEIRKRALSYRPRPVIIQKEPEPFHSYNSSAIDPGDTIEIVDHRKERNKTFNEVVMTSVVICLFAGGLYAGSTLLQTRKEIISPAATRVTPPSMTTVAKPSPVSHPIKQENTISLPEAIDSPVVQRTQAAITKERKALTDKIIPDSIDKPVSLQPVTVEKEKENADIILKLPGIEPQKKEEPVRTEAKKEEKKIITKDKADTSRDNKAVEKKKGLGEALKGIFGKKKKSDDKKENDRKKDKKDH